MHVFIWTMCSQQRQRQQVAKKIEKNDVYSLFSLHTKLDMEFSASMHVFVHLSKAQVPQKVILHCIYTTTGLHIEQQAFLNACSVGKWFVVGVCSNDKWYS